ncbi:hypothetical protein OAI75_00850 [Woeseiaceae bacterium]|nr:hypothetical protein [Woeseiaceae bacterium]
MPRRKTIQPPPRDSFSLEDGTFVEERDETCRIIGRGLHKVDAFEVQRDEILEIVVSDYFSPDQADPKRRPWKLKTNIRNDYLSSPTMFARKMQTLGYGGKEGVDDSTLRKSYYPDIVEKFRAYQRALEEIA